ncbi:class I SAM-dependent methyltransferase [uncultured Arcticibacterium sp.]|uniref:class I SAM-dependent methyltransferase n=1 Tax=uncultured Arcticibacterium sp. TaxID=2173042 RepID=UPI0030F5A070
MFIKKIIEKIGPAFYYNKINGYCSICEEATSFVSIHNYLRDNLTCSKCKSLPRERAIMQVINEYIPNWKSLKIHESSPIDRGISPKIKKQATAYSSSQYYPNEPSGEVINGFRNENLEELTFNDNSFDLIITQDVFEHLYNPEKAFNEISRVLKKGGFHIFTLPLINHFNKTQKNAVVNANGEVEFLIKEEYHGNPVDKKGSAVTYHWGSDIIDIIRNSTNGDETTIRVIEDMGKGISGELIEVFVTRKE